jgi:tetratricopeptide (TPR) repeat protein
MIFMVPVIAVLMMLFRPKQTKAKPMTEVLDKLLGDFAANAFSDDSKVSSAFRSALNDYSGNMPKSAINKLEKLQSQCQTDADTYAVSVALGVAKASIGNFEAAIKLYNKAVVIYPTTELAAAIGAAQQRMGELDQARDSYEFALELDPANIDARSALATAYVADGMFEQAIEEARLALEQNENHASSLATCAICYGILNETLLSKNYTDKAVANGYKAEKINSTITALKKKFKR